MAQLKNCGTGLTNKLSHLIDKLVLEVRQSRIHYLHCNMPATR